MFRLMTIEMPAKYLVGIGLIPSLPPAEKVDIVSVLKMRSDSVEMLCRVVNPLEGGGGQRDVFEHAKVSLLSSVEGVETYLVKYRIPSEIIAMLLDFDLYIQYPIVYAKGRFLISFMGRSEELASFLRSLVSSGADFALVSVKSYMAEEMSAGLLTLLTPAQRKMLVMATQMGYFDLPRKTDTRELARISGLKPSTVAEHLRRGQGKIFSHLLAPYIDRT